MMKRAVYMMMVAGLLFVSVSSCLAESTADVLNGFANLMNSMANLAQALNEPEETPEPKSVEKLSGPTVEVKVEGRKLKVHKEFKEQLDEYEEFFDSYIEVMSDEDVDLIKYMSFLTQYTEAMEALENIDEDTLSDDDMTYYLVVLNRINLKLLVVEP